MQQLVLRRTNPIKLIPVIRIQFTQFNIIEACGTNHLQRRQLVYHLSTTTEHLLQQQNEKLILLHSQKYLHLHIYYMKNLKKEKKSNKIHVIHLMPIQINGTFQITLVLENPKFHTDKDQRLSTNFQ